MSLRALVVHPLALEPRQAEAWDRFCLGDAHLRRAFLSPHFARAVGGVRRDARVLVLSDDREPVAFFAFQFANAAARAVGVAEPIGGDLADYVGLVAASGFGIAAEELLARAGLAGFDFTHLDESQAALGLRGEEFEAGLLIEIGGGFAEYWSRVAAANKDFVGKTERRQRNVVRDLGPLVLSGPSSDAAGDVARLVARKRAQYTATHVRDALAAPWKRALLARLAVSTAASCRGVYHALHAGDTLLAAHFGLACGERLHYWFPVYEPEQAKASPGRLLLKATLERARETGIAIVDRGAGDTPAKREFATAEHRFASGLWRRAGLREFLYRGGRSLAWRMRARRGVGAEAGE